VGKYVVKLYLDADEYTILAAALFTDLLVHSHNHLKFLNQLFNIYEYGKGDVYILNPLPFMQVHLPTRPPNWIQQPVSVIQQNPNRAD
jgi:hypothetical protein